MGTMYQGSLAKFDRKTKTFQTWGSPDFKNRDEARIAMVMPINSDVDGQVWIGGDNEYRVDVKTGEWKTVDYGVGVKDAALVKQLSSYGVSSDSKNNFYGMNLNGTYIIKVRREDEEGHAVPDADAGTPGLGGDTWTRRTGSGSRNSAPTRSGCSTRRPRSSRSFR